MGADGRTARTFVPVVACRTVIVSAARDGLARVWAEELIALAVAAVGRVRDRCAAPSISTVVLAEFLCNHVVPASMLGSFSIEVAHCVGWGIVVAEDSVAKRAEERLGSAEDKRMGWAKGGQLL